MSVWTIEIAAVDNGTSKQTITVEAADAATALAIASRDLQQDSKDFGRAADEKGPYSWGNPELNGRNPQDQ